MATAFQVTVDQLAQHEVLLGAGQQPGRGGRSIHCGHPEYSEGVGMECASDRLPDGAAEPRGDPGSQLGRSPPAERQHQQLIDGYPGSNPRDGCLDERGRLARSRSREHEQRTAPMLDNETLARVQLGWPPRRHRRRPDQPVAGDVHADIPACRHDSFRTRLPNDQERNIWARYGLPPVPSVAREIDSVAYETHALAEQPLALFGI